MNSGIHYVWLYASLTGLVIWLILYFLLRDRTGRREMLRVSFWTSLLGLTEPIFVPEYWNPPSLFDLAQKTGFDIESFLFAFAVGGMAVVVYEKIFGAKHEPVSMAERGRPRHKIHFLALFSAPAIFAILFFFTNLNPIYSLIISLFGGGLFAWYCRPDLIRKMFTSSLIFFGIYFVGLLAIVIIWPGYVEEVWNLSAISGVLIFGIPLEELLFAISFGFLWSGYYEHFKWYKIT